MRRVVYSVAMSLDGYIAGQNGEIDWIMIDPEIDFRGLMDRFDTVLMGRHSFEVELAHGGDGSMAGQKVLVVSRTLRRRTTRLLRSSVIIWRNPSPGCKLSRAKTSGCLGAVNSFAVCWMSSWWMRLRSR